ncbi:hypothetical protein OG230_14695 [Streptomyces sp. NBC_00234]|uniref:hypothetical protein n=1 Tax=Streptomyces sp. NBC_00234 TaxID=2903638 RepID=UPI002E29FE22|nr:hypothetical protein [Streptomyces sp. NBC_00234]
MSDSPGPAADISVDRLNKERELGSGGEGKVWAVANFRINNKWPMAYKEYKAATRLRLRPEVLGDMVRYLTEQPADTGEWLSEHTSWPLMLVTDGTGVCGYLMRQIPDAFFIEPAPGAPPKAAGFEFLLNGDGYLGRIGLSITPRQRFELLLDFARTLDRLDGMEVVLRDLSPKNVLFSLWPRTTCFVIDCDSMVVGGREALPATQTGGWSLPEGERTDTAEGVVHKFALLAARLFLGEQDGADLGPLRAADPAVAALAERALSPDPAARPTMAAWLGPLAAAVESAPVVPNRVTVTPTPTVVNSPPEPTGPPGPARARTSSAHIRPRPGPSQPSKGRAGRWVAALVAVALFGAWSLDLGPFGDSGTPGTSAERTSGQDTSDVSDGSSTADGSGSAEGERETQANALDSLVRENDGNRGSVAAAVLVLTKCPGSGELASAKDVFDEAGDERDRLVGELESLSVDELPSEVTSDLRAGWEASAAADRAYARLAEDMADGCTPEQVTSSSDWDEATEQNTLATTAKKDFVAGWNPVAEQYGLRTLAWDEV